MLGLRTRLSIAIASTTLLACNLAGHVPLDARGGGVADAAGADGEVAADAEATEGDGDGGRRLDASLPDGGSGPGPLTLVATTVELLAERVCDLDGDGLEDNAIANLDAASRGVFTAVINAAAEGNIEARTKLLVLHFPHLDDRSGPSDDDAVLILFDGDPADVREPSANPDDDFSGQESFEVEADSLDECGEPRFFFLHASTTAGELWADGGTAPVPVGAFVLTRGASAWGEIEPSGRGAELWACGHAAFSELGEAPGLEGSGDLTLLECFLAGGSVFGVPSLRGIEPDVDLDGDGLERIEVDGEGRITSCIDGDRSRIPGRDCWQDARMADAFGLAMRLEAVGARFAGRQEEVSSEDCAEPPERSLFDPA